MMRNMISKRSKRSNRNHSRRTTANPIVLKLDSQLAAILPPLTEAERARLMESIKYNGITEPLTMIGASTTG